VSSFFTAHQRSDSGEDEVDVSIQNTQRVMRWILYRAHTHTHLFNGPLSGTTRVGRYQKGKKNNLDFTEQQTVSGSGISWAICKSAPCCRQITMAAPHHSSFLQAGCPYCRPTNSVKALKAEALKDTVQSRVL